MWRFLSAIPADVWVILLGVIGTGLSALLALLLAELRKHTSNKNLLALIGRLELASRTAVAFVQQRLVSDISARGKLDADGAKAAASMALDAVKNELGKAALAELKHLATDDDVDGLILKKNESALVDLKAQNKALPVVDVK